MILHRHKPGPSIFLSYILRLQKLPRVHGRSTYVSCLPSLYNVVQCFHRLFDGGIVIPAVDIIEVYIIGSQSLKALINFTHNCLSGKSATIWTLMHSEKNPVSYTHLRAHETRHDLVCRLLLEKKKKKNIP